MKINLTSISFLIFALLCLFGWVNSCQDKKQSDEQNNALRSEMKKTVDKLGRVTFERQSFEGSYNAVAGADYKSDTIGTRLQTTIKERGNRGNTRSAVSFDAVTKGRAVGKSSVFAADTPVNVLGLLDPSYRIEADVASKPYKEGQPPTVTAHVIATPDSTTLDPYQVRVGFDIVSKESKRQVVTTIRPTDPNIEVLGMASYTQELPKKNRGFWAGVGAAVVIAASILLPR